MAVPYLLIATILSVAGAIAYGYVGWRLSKRRVEGPSRRASMLFSTWWAALAAATAIGALLRLATVAGWVDLPLYLTVTHLNLLLICVALWGLLYYLVYLLTGSRRAFVPITVGYALLYVAFVYLVTLLHPQELLVEDGRARIVYERTASAGVTLAALAGILAPPMVAALGYFLLFFRVDDATQRYRIGLVSGTIFAWFLSSVIAAVTEVSGRAWWQLAASAIGLCAALLILAAYVPPRWIRRRYGIAAIDEVGGTTGG